VTQRFNPHTTYPLRRIAALEDHDGSPIIVLQCGHTERGTPASKRYSKFYPCSACYERVLAARAEHAQQSTRKKK
jgi:hypothetical protein